jgi:hypothetical protein
MSLDNQDDPTPLQILVLFLPAASVEAPFDGFGPDFAPAARAVYRQINPSNPLEAIATAQAILAAYSMHRAATTLPVGPDVDDETRDAAIAAHEKEVKRESRRFDAAYAQIRRLRRPLPKRNPASNAAVAPTQPAESPSPREALPQPLPCPINEGAWTSPEAPSCPPAQFRADLPPNALAT